MLALMPETLPQRTQIAAELRSHIAERLAHSHALDDVLKQLGDPAKLADSYLWAEPLVSAPFGSRVLAKVVDAIAVLVVMCPTAWLLSRLAPDGFEPVVFIIIGVAGTSIAFGLYTMTLEYRRGQTIGKRLQRIRVVSESGARVSVGQALVRQLPMILRFSE